MGIHLIKKVKVDGASLEDFFEYLFDIGVENFLWKKEKDTDMIYLRNGIQSIFNLIKTLMIIPKMMGSQTILELEFGWLALSTLKSRSTTMWDPDKSVK